MPPPESAPALPKRPAAFAIRWATDVLLPPALALRARFAGRDVEFVEAGDVLA